LPVWLRFQHSDAQSLDDLGDFKVRRPDGTQIPADVDGPDPDAKCLVRG
jgi:hypothetical protein